jgi:hypothetical protein
MLDGQCDLLQKLHFFLKKGGWRSPSPESAEFPQYTEQKPWALVLENISIKDIHSALVEHVEQQNLDAFINTLQERLNELDKLTDTYAFRLSAEEMNAILELRGSLLSLHMYFSEIADEERLYSMAKAGDVEVNKIKAEYLNQATPRLHEAISQLIQMFGSVFPPQSFGLPKG